MATTFNTPGVYIQEITKLPASIAQVATAIPAFIGYTQKSSPEPVRISSMLEFVTVFGGPHRAIKIVGSSGALAGGTNPDDRFILYYCMQMYFANGGGACYVVSAGTYGTDAAPNTATDTDLIACINKLITEDEPTLIVIPEAIKLASTAFYSVMNEAVMHAAKMQDRFVITDLHDDTGVTLANTMNNFRGGITSQNVKYAAAYFPRLVTTLTYPDSAIYFDTSFAKFTDEETVPKGLSLEEVIEKARTDNTTSSKLNSIIKTLRENIAAKLPMILPPGSSMAGIYAAVDSSRGVWKAPANVSVTNVMAPSVKVNDEDHGLLNVDPTSGKSINVIRTFTGKGNLVWGARTLAGNDNEWRYVNVRRLFITVEESIKKATEFVVFEPNDSNTWIRVKTMIENYLTGLWRDGALAGAKPEEAFFVNVGLGITMTAEDVLNGKLIIEVGMAAVRPAEFIILKFSHKLQEN